MIEGAASFWRLSPGRDGPRLVRVATVPARGLVLDNPTRKLMARCTRALRRPSPHPGDVARAGELLASLERAAGIFTDEPGDATSLAELVTGFLEAARRLRSDQAA